MPNSGFIALVTLAIIHLFANKAKALGWIWHGRFIAFAAGISFAYVFVDLLPALEKGQPVLKRAFGELIPYFDRHTYVIALFGVLFYYGLHTQSENGGARNFWLSVSGYILFNFFVGASLSDANNPEIQPIMLFTIAVGMHYLVADRNAGRADMSLYEHSARWLLIAALFIGFAVGMATHIPDTFVVLAVSFLAGGILLNTLKYELPKRERGGFLFFVFGSLLYTGILLGLR